MIFGLFSSGFIGENEVFSSLGLPFGLSLEKSFSPKSNLGGMSHDF